MDLHQKQKDANVVNLIVMLNANLSIKHSFMVVKKLEHLSSKVDKTMRNKAAKLVNNLKRCVFNMEDNYRKTI